MKIKILHLMTFFLFLCLLLFLAGRAHADAAANLATWQANMTKYGQQHCAYIKEHIYDDPHLNGAYYDGERVYYQIADYTGDPTWNSCAQASEWLYRDNYMKSPGGPAGYWNFGKGLAEDFKRTGDQQSSASLDYLSNQANWCRGTSTELADLATNPELAREASYCLNTYVEEIMLGRAAPLAPKFVEYLKSYIVKWQAGAPMQAFMCGLLGEALSNYYQNVSADPSILTSLDQLSSLLWAQRWDATSKSFKYDNHDGTFSPAPDLNLLIAPMYAWLYYRTGNSAYALKFDQIFDGGVNGAWITGAKQFNQNYRSSFQALKWRFPAATPTPVPTVTPSPTPTKTPTPAPTATPIPTATPCGMDLSLGSHDCRLRKLEAR